MFNFQLQFFPFSTDHSMTNTRNKHYLHLLRNWSTAEAISDHVIFCFFHFYVFQFPTKQPKDVCSLLGSVYKLSLFSCASKLQDKFRENLMDQKMKPEKASNVGLKAINTKASTALNFRSTAKWILKGNLLRHHQPQSTLLKASSTHSTFIQNDLSIKVTSCKGRGSCFYFFQHSYMRHSSQISCQLEWMWFD